MIQPPESLESGIMPEDEPSLGEIARRLLSLEVDIRADIKDINDKISTRTVAMDYYNARHDALMWRVNTLERSRDDQARRWWSLIIAVLASVVGSGVAVTLGLITALH